MTIDSVTAAVGWGMLEALRGPEGNSIFIPCDNPEGDMFVTCNGDFTNYEDQNFTGPSIIRCLERARQVQEEWKHREAVEFQAKLAALGTVQP